MRLSLNKFRGQGTRDRGQGIRRGLLICALGSFLFLMGASKANKPAVLIKKLKNNHYQLIVNNKPYVIKGVCYNPVPIGQGHDYDWWADPYKPWLVDGKLMQEMGVNTIRVYKDGTDGESVKQAIGDLYKLYGIRTVMGHWLGFWHYPCPLYADVDFQDTIRQEVLNMVKTYKDEPGILMWVLGNENNYSFNGAVNSWSCPRIDEEQDPIKRVAMRAEIYYSFVNSLAKEIHAIDPNHPVVLGNGEAKYLEYAALVCPDIDAIGCIIYRGRNFANLFNGIRFTFDKPVIFTEFGADSYDAFKDKEDQNMQAFFLESQWREIYQNLANNKEGAGNCLGGLSFEWTDEWWKNKEYDPDSFKVHDTGSNWSNPGFYMDNQAKDGKNMNEEWFGIVALSDTEIESGLNKRIPRKAYYIIRDFWKNPLLKSKKKK